MPSAACALVGVVFIISSAASMKASQEPLTVQGEWSLNRELTPAATERPNGDRPPGRGRPRGGGDFPGGMPGGSAPGGGFGGGGGMGGRGPSEKEQRSLEAVRRRLEEIPQRLLITVDGTRVQIVDEFGRLTTLSANGNKQDRLTGDGEFKSTTKIEAGRLTIEEDFGTAKITTTYERLAIDESIRLKATLRVDGLRQPPGGRDAAARDPIVRIYDLTR